MQTRFSNCKKTLNEITPSIHPVLLHLLFIFYVSFKLLDVQDFLVFLYFLAAFKITLRLDKIRIRSATNAL